MGIAVSFFDRKTAPYPDQQLVKEFDRASRASLELGGNAEYLLSKAITLSGGLRYTEKGGGYKTKNPDFIYTNSISGNKTGDAYNYLRYRLVYLEIPVLVRLNLNEMLHIKKSKDSDLSLYGGVAGMLNIGSKLRYNVFSADEKESWESDKLDAKRFVLSTVAGVQWRDRALILYARYTNNISPVYDTSKPGYETFDVKMYTISLGLGVIVK